MLEICSVDIYSDLERFGIEVGNTMRHISNIINYNIGVLYYLSEVVSIACVGIHYDDI